MTISNELKKEIEAYEKGPFEDMTLQDAFVIIAVYVARIDPQDCEKDIRRIEKIAETRPEFVQKRKDLFSRINTYANSILVIGPQKALQIAADALIHPEHKNAAFDFAVEVAMPGGVLTDEKKVMLDKIAAELSIDRKLARQTIEKFTG
jgi:tellurite resistance protein